MGSPDRRHQLPRRHQPTQASQQLGRAQRGRVTVQRAGRLLFSRSLRQLSLPASSGPASRHGAGRQPEGGRMEEGGLRLTVGLPHQGIPALGHLQGYKRQVWEDKPVA